MTGSAWGNQDWALFSQRLAAGHVTPVLGAGASIDVVGSTVKIAGELARLAHLGFAANEPLDRVGQYAAEVDRDRAGELMRGILERALKEYQVADVPDEHFVYRYLTGQPIDVWLTTNYDDLIDRGLSYNFKSARVSVALWAPPGVMWEDKEQYELTDWEPTTKNPLVFHLHGRYGDVRSMVISEADYLEYLEQMAAHPDELLPDVVNSRIAGSSLLFVGYSFNDSNFQLLLRQWATSKLCYAVQPAPEGMPESELGEFTPYYEQRLEALTRTNIKVFWGTASDFCRAHAAAAS